MEWKRIYTKNLTDPTFQYRPTSPEVVIKELLNQYHQQINAARFELVVGPEGIYNVVPIKYLNREGKFVQNSSILDVKISLSVQDVTYASIMQRIYNTLSHKLTGPPIPFGLLFNIKGSVFWHNKEIRFCINEILGKINEKFPGQVKYSWHARRGTIYDKEFPVVLDIHKISPIGTDSKPWRIKVEAIRPLAEALKILEENLRYTITYEDTPYLCPCNVMRDRSGKPQVPSGGIIDFSYSPDDNPGWIIQFCLAAYHNDPVNPAIFTVERVGNIFHVFPLQVKDENGNLMPYKPILDTSISISESSKSSLYILKSILAKVAERSEGRINLGKFPQNAFSSSRSFNLSEKPARVVLTEFVKSIADNLSWQLLYDPKSRGYALNIHSIPGY